MKQTYFGVRGTQDFSCSQTLQFNRICRVSREILHTYGYQEIILPILEDAVVFNRSAGETSDIVEKQIFKIAGRNNENEGTLLQKLQNVTTYSSPETESKINDQQTIVLRPEGTAQVIRYFLENSLYNQADFYKFSYFGSMFRGERPQKGRLRQFNHIGVEALGADSPFLDAEMVILAWTILEKLGIKEKEIKINTLGCCQDKELFGKFLNEALQDKYQDLCCDCQRRLKKNPLRVIDCKRPECKTAVQCLEIGNKHLCRACKDNFEQVLKILDEAGVKYVYSPYLVRGLDYYTNTVFEITSTALGSQDAIGAGGRYNNLIESMGGPKFPASGFALGIERIMLILGEPALVENLDVYVVIADQQLSGRAALIVNILRQNGIAADMDFMGKSVKAQIRNASRKNSRFAAILGNEEFKQNSVMLKNMQTSEQVLIKIEDITKYILSV